MKVTGFVQYENGEAWDKYNFVCTLQQSKTLRDLGVMVDAPFWWVCVEGKKFAVWSRKTMVNDWSSLYIQAMIDKGEDDMHEIIRRNPDKMAEDSVIKSITDPYNNVQYPAFTTHQLSLLLPNAIKTPNDLKGNLLWNLWVGKTKDGFFAGYFNLSNAANGAEFMLSEQSDTQAKAMAKLLISMMKKQYIIAKDAINILEKHKT